MQRAQARIALEQEARPDARPVGRAGEQPGHGGRRHLGGRRRAPACPPPARAADHPTVSADLDLDQGRLLGAVGRVRASAAPAHPRIGGRVVLLGAFLKPRALRAAVAGRAGLPAPPPPRTRPLPPLARAAGIPPGQPRTRRAKLRQLAFEALDPPPRHPHPLAEPRLLQRQRSDRRLLPPRPAQGLAQLPPQRRDDRVRLDAVLVKVPHLGRAGIERLLQRPTLLAKPRHLHPQRHHRAALPRVHAGLPKQTVQTLHLALQRQGVPRRPAGLPRLRDDLPQPPARRLPPPLPRSRVAPRPHLRPPQLLGARLRRLRPLPLPLVQRPPVRRLRRLGTGHRPKLLRPPGQRHARMSVCVPYRHALDDTTFRMALPVPPQNNPHDRSSTAWPNSYYSSWLRGVWPPADPVTDDVTRQAIDALKAELSDPRALKLSARLHRQSVEGRIDHDRRGRDHLLPGGPEKRKTSKTRGTPRPGANGVPCSGPQSPSGG